MNIWVTYICFKSSILITSFELKLTASDWEEAFFNCPSSISSDLFRFKHFLPMLVMLQPQCSLPHHYAMWVTKFDWIWGVTLILPLEITIVLWMLPCREWTSISIDLSMYVFFNFSSQFNYLKEFPKLKECLEFSSQAVNHFCWMNESFPHHFYG